MSVLACAPPQLVCPDGFTLSAEGRCVTNDAGTVVPVGDGSVSPDAGSDAGNDAAMAAIDGGVPGVDAYVEGVDAAISPDAYVAPPDAYVAPDACAYGTWYVDADHDGYGAAASPVSACSQPAGTVSDATDCDDMASTRHPGASEVCNGTDDDCDGVVDEGVMLTWFYDGDGDGHGITTDHVLACTMPPHYVASSDDCDDMHASVYPGATEICDGLRNDCTSAAPDAELMHTYYSDCDRDGYSRSTTGLTTCQPPGVPPECSTGQYVTLRPTDASNTDCADFDATRTPTTAWYPDCDGDGYLAVGATATHTCDMPATSACTTGTATIPHGVWTRTPSSGTDCWDFNGGAHPGSYIATTTGYSTGLGISYDWDCDGVGTPTITSAATGCMFVFSTSSCSPSSQSWQGTSPPPCGGQGTLITCGAPGCAVTSTMTHVVPICH